MEIKNIEAPKEIACRKEGVEEGLKTLECWGC